MIAAVCAVVLGIHQNRRILEVKKKDNTELSDEKWCGHFRLVNRTIFLLLFGAIVIGINVVAVIAFVVGYKKYFLIHVKKA